MDIEHDGVTLTLANDARAIDCTHVGLAVGIAQDAAGIVARHVTIPDVASCSCNTTPMVSSGMYPPVFSAITNVSGQTAINLYCTTDRESIVRFRGRKLVAGVETGSYITSLWESVPKTTGHGVQLDGLEASTTYRVQIEINATDDPDLGWSGFAAGGAGPDFATQGSGGNPDKPEPEEP